MRILGLADLGPQTGDGGCRCSFLSLELRRIENGNQVSLFYRRTFLHQQFCDAASDLRADDDLIRIHRADQHQIVSSRR